MSRTRESTVIASPVEAYIYFQGNTGKFGKSADGQEGMEDVPLPLTFVVLDDGAYRIGGETRGGGNKRKIGSNLAHRDFGNHLVVNYKDNGANLAEGFWKDIKQRVTDIGGKYTLVLFVLTKIDGAYKMAAIHLRGRALSEWFKFIKGKNTMGEFAYTVKSVIKTEGEEIDSFIPIFSEVAIKLETVEEANAADTILQVWMKSQFSNEYGTEAARTQTTRGDDFPTDENGAPPVDSDDLPF